MRGLAEVELGITASARPSFDHHELGKKLIFQLSPGTKDIYQRSNRYIHLCTRVVFHEKQHKCT